MNYRLACDAALFDCIRQNDKEAFAELFNRYWQKAFAMAYGKVRCRQTTEEIVQELFIQLWDKRHSLSIQNFSPFLYTCVKNKCLNHIESLLIRKKHWEYYRTFICEKEERPATSIQYNELLEAINSGMEDLPPKTQKIFKLSRVHGLSIPEIASILNLSEKAIEYHLTRSLKQLRVHLKDFMLLLILIYF